MLRNRVYYSVKPFIPRAWRLAARRLHAERIRRHCDDVWPINRAAARQPEDWNGWPNGNQFALVLTHDVEGPIGLSRVRALAELEMKLGFRSSFNFIPEGEYSVDGELRNWLTTHGFEVGVHDLNHDGKLYRSHGLFQKRAARINEYLQEWNAAGFRSGFMLRNLDWIHDLKIQYDCSTFDTDPFEPQPDGAGTIFPFFISGPRGSAGFVELPYTLPQDFTMFLLLQERDCRIWRRKTRWIVQNGGMVLMNTHPDYFCFDEASPDAYTFPARHYAEFLQWLRNEFSGSFWPALPRDVAAWYRREVTPRSPSDRALVEAIG